MKNITLLIALLIGLSVSGQSLKGFTMGETLGDKTTSLFTTVAGIEGTLMASTINDGRIYQLTFIPSKSLEGKESRISSSDLSRLVKGIEENYNTKFKSVSEEYSDEVTAYYTTDFKFYIDVDYNQFLEPGYKIAFLIMDPDLNKIYEKEEQIRASKDF